MTDFYRQSFKASDTFMPFLLRVLPAACCAALLLSCHSSSKLAAPQYRLMDTITVSARNNPLDIYRATTPRVWEIVHTGLILRFDFLKKEAQGEALLSVMAYTSPADTLVLDAKSMKIAAVQVKNDASGSMMPLSYRYEDEQLKIDVRGLEFGSLAVKRRQLIRIEYTAQPYAEPVGGSRAITEDRGLYFINTDGSIPGKPIQIWTQGETESNSHWMPTIDKPNQRSTFDIALIVPDTMQTLSNGQLMKSSPTGDGLRKDEWRMYQPIQVYAAMFAIGRFAIAKESWKDPQGAPVEVSYYTEPAFGPYAKEMFRNTPEMMSCFSKTTGVAYPWNKYSQIVVRDYVSGAMENTTASLFAEYANKTARQLTDEGNEDIISHELFHQWFGDYVTAESWSNLTLNESFATYGEQIWRRYRHGQASEDEQAWNDLQRYLGAAERADPPLVRYYYRDREEMFDRISYQKGASILRYIHSIAGDTLFSKSMEFYLCGNALESAEAGQWRLALETATGKDWALFFNQWYYRGGHPVLRVHYAYDDAAGLLKVTVRQASSPDTSILYTLPLKACVLQDGGRRYEDWLIRDRSQTFTIPYAKGGSRPVIIPDAQHVLPGRIREDKAVESWLTQIRYSGDYVSKRLAIDAAIANETADLSPAIMKTALKDTGYGIRLYALQQLAGVERQSWKDALLRDVKEILFLNGSNRVRAAAFTVLGAWKDRTELPAMISAVSDSSYYIAGAALQALSAIGSDTAYTLANDILKADPKGPLLTAAWTAIVSKGAPADIERFQETALRVYGLEKVALANNVERYAYAVKNNALFERALRLLADMAKGEPIRGYRLNIGSNLFELRDAYRKKSDASRKALAEKYAADVALSETEPDNQKRYRSFGN